MAPVRLSLSRPIFCCLAKPRLITVVGNKFFGIILSVLKGRKILGKFNLTSAPYSERLKNTSLGFANSVEEPMFPRSESSRVSAPLKIFLKVPVTLPVIPKD
ncbi:hypothetical protein D3C80_1257110 [compost metagenome]